MTHYRIAISLALLALAPAAFGQTIYRSTMPDGRTVLSDRPTPGAKKVEEVYVPGPTPQTRSAPGNPATGAKPIGDKPLFPSGQQGTAAQQLDAALAELRDAQEAFKEAEAVRLAAQEPVEGERQGTAGGGSRLNEEYFQRQAALATAVEVARRRVNDAQAKVNSLR